MKKTAMVLAAALLLTGCGPADEETYRPPLQSQSTEEVSGLTDAESAELAFRVVWADMTIEDKAMMCLLWVEDQEDSLDDLMSAMGEAGDALGEYKVTSLMNEVCGQ